MKKRYRNDGIITTTILLYTIYYILKYIYIYIRPENVLTILPSIDDIKYRDKVNE